MVAIIRSPANSGAVNTDRVPCRSALSTGYRSPTSAGSVISSGSRVATTVTIGTSTCGGTRDHSDRSTGLRPHAPIRRNAPSASSAVITTLDGSGQADADVAIASAIASYEVAAAIREQIS